MNLVTHSLVMGVILPITAGVIALGIPLALRWKEGGEAAAQESENDKLEWLGGLGLALGYAVGYVGLLGFPKWGDTSSQVWMFWLLPFVLLLGVFDTALKLPRPLVWAGRAALFLVMYYMMFRTQVEEEIWTKSQLFQYVGIMAALALIVWALWENTSDQVSEATLGWVVMVVSLLTSFVIVLSGSAKFGQMMGVMISVLGVWWVLSWFAAFRKIRARFVRGILPVFVMIYMGYCLNGFFYTDMTKLTAAMLLLVPVLLWLGSKLHTPSKSWQKVLYYTALAAAPVLVALGVLGYKELNKPKKPKDMYGSLVKVERAAPSFKAADVKGCVEKQS
ncbi:MAG: hypothetical protein EP343_26660 [Deltaproteobacteria bacterium]|nr:MAG: hypothetical protein EP343_26660 [Deltaproteobacteria bacterium]